MIKAAGIMFLTKGGKTLFLQRGLTSDYPGTWCLPGGHIEKGETAEEAARREAVEEVGPHKHGPLVLHTRRIADHEVGPGPGVPGSAGAGGIASLVPSAPMEQVDFTTFLQELDEEFTPDLNSEHVAYAWATPAAPPEPLHPGVRVALARLGMNELDVAREMAQGELVSPQRLSNVTLFAMRITGTGTSYRPALKEYVYRKPEHYLTENFLARCNGLPVILEHPEKAVLNSKEFKDRMVGTILLPYIVGDEVWGIAKIYDDTTAQMMIDEQLSTSPTVQFRNPKKSNTSLSLENGEKMLIEGDPELLDHLAICRKGVWDKGGEPRGVLVETREDSIMTEEELKAKADAEAKAKADADAGEKLDKILTAVDSVVKRVDSVCERMDSFESKEKAKADAEEAAAKAKADAEAEEKRKAGDEEQAKKDAAEAEAKEKADAEAKEKADAEEKEALKADSADLRKQLEELKAKLPLQLSDADHAAMTAAQAKADSVFAQLGKRAPRPMDGETLLLYRRRLANDLKEHSNAWKGTDLAAIADEAAFTNIESVIYADAVAAAHNPAGIPEGQLREVVDTDSTGRRSSKFYGEPRSWMDGFSAHRRRLTGIRNN